MNYFLAPRSGEKSYENYKSTIKYGVPLDRIEKFLPAEGIHKLKQEEIIYAWGNRLGTKSHWEAMQTGDTVIFYAKGALIMSGEVYYKYHNADLALALWPPDEKGNPWEFTFFIKNTHYFNVPIKVFNKTAGYKDNYIVQGFTPLKGMYLENIEAKYGSVEKFLNLFLTQNTEEIPQSEEKIYLNVKREITPRLNDKKLTYPIYKVNTSKVEYKTPKIDFEEKQKKDAITGSKGEEIVLKFEKEVLINAGRSDLASQVGRKSVEDDSLGYDILSFDTNGEEKHIEVKSTTGKGKKIQFHLSSKEFLVSKSLNNYYIYVVENTNADTPLITIIKAPLTEDTFLIQPESYIVTSEKTE